ncbi:MAG: hypothetical protein H6738_21660 [Alphaproteobacteria bacterium]|nr:hypothetical protein [Alphaproteobacteria bacterium]MCB9699404.1 hypothetical protein [Alphaproteobacteria bacterium]
MRLGPLLTALAACSGTGTGGPTDSETGTTPPETGTSVCTSAPSFDTVYTSILEPSCELSGCHTSTDVNGMNLTEATAYDALVNVAAQDAPGETLVIPGDPDGSYVVKKLEDAPDIVGDPMPWPFGNQPVGDIAEIRDWIACGANP